MEQQTDLYVMLSRTSTDIGRVIRLFSHDVYNHVSLSLDPSFRHWVSFARYVQGVPLAGGFVNESAARFFAMEGPVPVKIYRVPLTAERSQQLHGLFAKAGMQRNGLIYNTFGLLATAIGLEFHVPGAYTCLDFASAVLEQDYKRLSALEEDMAPHLIYAGDFKVLLSDDGSRSDAYFDHRGFRRGTLDTAGHFGRLVYRTIRPSHCRDPLRQLNL